MCHLEVYLLSNKILKEIFEFEHYELIIVYELLLKVY